MPRVGIACYRVVVRRVSVGRSAMSGLGLLVVLLTLATVAVAADIDHDHQVEGRFAVTSEAGGAIWAFQPGGLLILTGPGDISSEGTWGPAAGEREFDATIEYGIAGQTLTVRGEVAPGGDAIAVYVQATDAQRPGDADPWPSESRLLGERLGMVPEATPAPSAPPPDCLRPQWLDGMVDWDRCDSQGVSTA